MELSEIGLFAQQLWFAIPTHFPFVDLDAFVVMPNHIHGILIIDRNGDEKNSPDFNIENNFDSEININTPSQQRFRNQGKNTISSIIGSYKSAVSSRAHLIKSGFGWQARFYDHIVQSDREFNRIWQYIDDNPAKWGKDKYFGEG